MGRFQYNWAAAAPRCAHLYEGDFHVELVQALVDDLAQLWDDFCVRLRHERLALADLWEMGQSGELAKTISWATEHTHQLQIAGEPSQRNTTAASVQLDLGQTRLNTR